LVTSLALLRSLYSAALARYRLELIMGTPAANRSSVADAMGVPY
jgi:hypothetical protein